MRWRNREHNCEIQVLYHLKQEPCWWIWNALNHYPNFQCPSRPLFFLKHFFSSREWSFPTLLESLFSFKPCMKTLFFFSAWFYLKEVLAEIREYSGKSRILPPLSQLPISLCWASLCFRPPSWVSPLRSLQDIWSSVSGSGYFWPDPL